MKREIIKEFDMLGDALSTLNAQFAYRLMNLCVKAEPVSLLSIEAMIEGKSQKLEECAQIGQEDDYSFQIFPNYDGDIPALAKAILMDHPEFKQEMKTMQVDISTEEGKSDMQDVHYILVTMPDVDDNRYDVLKNGVNGFYEENKAQMEAVSAKHDAKIATLLDGESPEDVKKVKEARDKQTKTWYEQRDTIYNDKVKEIEEAHVKWQNKQKTEKLNRLKSV
jgi:competence protein ComGC